MVTVASFLVFILLTSLLLVIDITTYHYSLMEAWWNSVSDRPINWQNSPLSVHVPSALYQPLLSILESGRKNVKSKQYNVGEVVSVGR